MAESTHPALTTDELNVLMAEYLPDTDGFRVLDVSPAGVLFRADPAVLSIRPGGTVSGPAIFTGTVSGPAIFTFADIAGYLTVNAYLGRTPLAMLTSSSISFLEAPEPGVLHAFVEMLRLGRRSGVCTARVQDERGGLVAMATLHFSFPASARIR